MIDDDVAGRVALFIGLPGLAGKGEEDCCPRLIRMPYQQPTILVNTIGIAKTPLAALVHVDIVDTIAGQKVKIAVRLRFGAPGFAKEIELGACFGNALL